MEQILFYIKGQDMKNSFSMIEWSQLSEWLHKWVSGQVSAWMSVQVIDWLAARVSDRARPGLALSLTRAVNQ